MTTEVFKELLEYCHVAMCNSATCATCATNLTMTVTQPKTSANAFED